MKRSLIGDPTECSLDDRSSSEDRMRMLTAFTSVASNDVHCENVTEPTQVSSDFAADVNLHFPFGYPAITVTAANTHEPVVQSETTHAEVSNNNWPPRQHMRFVLQDEQLRVIAKRNIECSNCGTTITTTWRRNAEGKKECNACHLYRRRNGLDRPLSLRRDVIARRRRQNRPETRPTETVESEGGQANFSQLQKAISCRRQSNRSSSRGTNIHDNTVKLSHTNKSQSRIEQNHFFLSDVGYTQSPATFVKSNVYYNDQNPMMIRYNAERASFNAMNIQQQATSFNADDQFNLAKPSQSTFSSPDVFGRHMMTIPTNANTNVIRQEGINDNFTLTDENLHHEQMELHQGFVEYPLQQELVRRDVTSDNQFECQYRKPFATMKVETPYCNLPSCSSTAHLSEVNTANVDDSSGSLTETFGLFMKKALEDDNDETARVYQSL